MVWSIKFLEGITKLCKQVKQDVVLELENEYNFWHQKVTTESTCYEFRP